jgi:hypothetical protein
VDLEVVAMTYNVAVAVTNDGRISCFLLPQAHCRAPLFNVQLVLTWSSEMLFYDTGPSNN